MALKKDWKKNSKLLSKKQQKIIYPAHKQVDLATGLITTVDSYINVYCANNYVYVMTNEY